MKLKLLGLRPEARIGYVEINGGERAFNVSCAVRKGPDGKKVRFATAKDLQRYIQLHHVGDVVVTLSPDAGAITEVIVP
jgi:hypothetical protein